MKDVNRDIRTSGRYEDRKAFDEEHETGQEKKYTQIGRRKKDIPKNDKDRSDSTRNSADIGKHNYKFFRKSGNRIKETPRDIKHAINRLESEEHDLTEQQDMNENVNKDTDKFTKKIQKAVVIIVSHIVHLAFSVAASFFSTLGVIIVTAVVVTVIAFCALQNATYDFIVDNEQRIREAVSQINNEFTDEINRISTEAGCEKVVTHGTLAPWKEIIAFWWTFKSRCSDTQNWNDYFSGNDHDDLEKLFYEFNHIESEVKSESGVLYLEIIITNVSLEDMVEDYQFTSTQRKYLDGLLADDAVWDELLYSNELAMYAEKETGQSRERYAEWYPLPDNEGWNMAFMMYVLDEAGYVGTCITKTDDLDAFMHELMKKGYMKFIDAKEGDIIFLNLSGQNAAGIITGMNDNAYYITLGDYPGSQVVCEITVAKNNSNVIRGFAEIDISLVSIPGNNSVIVTAGELIWPASGCYMVTSPYGQRSMFGRNFHYGMDIACPVGTPILSASAGTVMTATYNSSAGNYVVIDHGDFKTVYMHNSSLQVAVGEQVSAGQVIALSGNTGDSTGPHCHFGLSIGGYIDPAPYLGLPEGFTGDASVYIK